MPLLSRNAEGDWSEARRVLSEGPVAAACSGFHHAEYAHASGYCTFNGLMVTALVLCAEGRVRRVAILDFDQHYGDGTDEIEKMADCDLLLYQAGRLAHPDAPSDA